MTTLKTIAATAVIAVGGTVAAFTGLHIGQTPADAATGAQPAKPAKATYTVTMTAKDLATLARMMNGQQAKATGQGKAQHRTRAHKQRQQRQTNAASQRSTSRTYTRSGSGSSGSGSHHYYGDGHSGCWGGSSNSGGGSHHGSGSWGCD